MNKTDSHLTWRAVIVLGLVAFGFYLATDRGLVGLALSSDESYISSVILAIYVLASLHWLWLAHSLATERRRFAELQAAPDADPTAAGANTLVDQFFANWRLAGTQHDPAVLLSAFGDELINRHALGHFLSEVLLKLGLLGTIVGFILMLIPVASIEEFDASVMQQLLAAMSGGMAVALYTTLAGLVTSTLLKLQYHLIDASAADLSTRLSVLADTQLSHAP